MAHVQHKKVDLVELFFDLVMVYAISQTTGLIHHLHAGVVDPWSLVSFALAYVILVNAWMYQVVFTNRFGRTSARDITFSLASMALLLFLSSTISADWQESFRPFSITLGLLFLVQMVQYALAYAGETGRDARFLIRGFLLLTGIYALALFLGAVLPYGIGIYFTMGGLIANVALPLAFMRRLNHIPLNFPHLVERLTLLVIITFGEMIIGVAPWFTPETLSLLSALVFCVCAALFVHYVWVFDRMIDLDVGDQGAYRLQYAHIPIFLGLGMVTVSFAFLAEPEADMRFVVAFMYVGLFLFYLGLGGSNPYRQQRFRASRRQLAWQGAAFAVAFAACMALADVRWAVVLLTDLLAAGECLAMWALYRRGLRAHVDLKEGEMELVVKRFDELSAAELHDILKLRVDVFVVEQECFYPDVDGLDPGSVHVCLVDEGGAIAAYARVFDKPDEPGVVKIGRVIAVKRGAGLGRAVMEAAMHVASDELGAGLAYLEAQVRAQGFYEKLGFTACSEPFDEAGIPHVAMRRQLGPE